MGMTLTRAFLVATAILATTDLLWLLGALALPPLDLLGFVVWLALPVAAFVAARLAPKRNVVMGTATVIPAAILFAATNATFQALGREVDFSGWEGALIVVSYTLPFGGLLCAVGAALGYLSIRGKAHA
jgi:hypothetical protein